MATVYVVQNQHRLDERTGNLVPKYPSIRLAEEFGTLSFLLSPSASPFNPEPVIKELDEKLAGIGSDDYLLLVGNPILIGWACALACDYNDGRLNTLQWNSTHKRYIPVQADLDVAIRENRR